MQRTHVFRLSFLICYLGVKTRAQISFLSYTDPKTPENRKWLLCSQLFGAKTHLLVRSDLIRCDVIYNFYLFHQM